MSKYDKEVGLATENNATNEHMTAGQNNDDTEKIAFNLYMMDSQEQKCSVVRLSGVSVLPVFLRTKLAAVAEVRNSRAECFDSVVLGFDVY